MENKILAVRFAQRKYALEKYELGQIKKIRAAANKAINEYLAYADLKKDAIFGQGKWTREKGLKYVDQLKKLDGALKQQVVDMTTGTGRKTFKDAIKAYEGILSFDGGVGAFNFTDLSPEKLEALVKGIPVGGNTLKEWADRTLDRNVQRKIRDELLTGSLKGENIEQLKRRVRQRYKTFSRNTVDVMVRTHIQSANNHALQKVYEENRHVVHRVQWLATLDAASCLRCAALDGREYEHNDHPHIPVHPRCRCVLLPVTRTWKEMGIDRDEMKKRYRPELQDDGTYKKVQKTYTQRYNEMSADAKRAFIGPGRYNYLKKSKLEFPDLVNNRTGDLYLLKDLPKVEKLKLDLALWSGGFDDFFTSRGITIENGYRDRDGFSYVDGVSAEKLDEVKKDFKEAIEAYERKGLNVPVNLQIVDDMDHPLESIAIRAKSKTVYNLGKEKKTLKTFREVDEDWKPGEIPGYVTHNRRDIFVHEIAHRLEDRATGKEQRIFADLFKETPADNFPSFYAQENSLEFWAESIAAKILGNAADCPSFQRLTPEVSEFLDGILDRWKQPRPGYRRMDTLDDAAEWAAKRDIKLEGFTDADLDVVNDTLRAVHNSKVENVRIIEAINDHGGNCVALDIDDTGTVLTWKIGVSIHDMKDQLRFFGEGVDYLPDPMKYYKKDGNYNMAVIKKKLAAPTAVRDHYDLAMHEIGHAQAARYARFFRDGPPGGFKHWGELDDAYRAWVGSDSVQNFFSGYAAKSYDEALAEAYVLIKRGEYKRGMLPPYLEELLGFERAVVTRKASDELVEKMVKRVDDERIKRKDAKKRATVRVLRARARKEKFNLEMAKRHVREMNKNRSNPELFEEILRAERKKIPKREYSTIHGDVKAYERAHLEYMKQIAKDYPEMPSMEDMAKFYKKKGNLPLVKKMHAEAKAITRERDEIELKMQAIEDDSRKRLKGRGGDYINSLPEAEQIEIRAMATEYNVLGDRLSELNGKFYAMVEKIDRYEADYFRGKVLPPRGGKIVFDMEDKATEQLLNNKHMKELESMFHPNLLEELSTVTAKKNADGRSFYRPGQKYTELDGLTDTTVHEYGHHVEYELPGLQERARAFLKKRAGDEKLSKIYKDLDEWGWKDEFFSHYCGKYYEHGSTEIISMGLEQMYKDPARFFASDPEYFDFIRRIMWGKDGLAYNFAPLKTIEMRKASKKLVEKMIKKVEAEEMARAAKKNRAFEIREKVKARKEEFEREMGERLTRQKEKNRSNRELFNKIKEQEMYKIPARERGTMHGFAKAMERAHIEYMKQIAKDYPEMPAMEDLAKFYEKKSNLPVVKKMKAEGKKIKEEIAELDWEIKHAEKAVAKGIPSKFYGREMDFIKSRPKAEQEELCAAVLKLHDLNDKRSTLTNEMFAMADKINRYELEYFRGKILPPKGGKIIIDAKDKATEELLNSRHMKELESMFHPNLLEELSTIKAKKNADGRSFYRPGEKYTELNGKQGVTIHEYGHHVELEIPGLNERARAFLKKRAGNEELTRIYADKEEWGFKDEFFDHYCGKVYDEYDATEIVSMGLQRMYQNPANFFATDPEYFEFIYRIMWGKEGLVYNFAPKKK